MIYRFHLLGGVLLALLPNNSRAQKSESKQRKMNVLMLIADDLRPELGCYGVSNIKTPNIDKLAQRGTLFENAYCNIPVSGASRASLLTGMYPKLPNRFIDYEAYACKDVPNAISMPRWFKENGYYTVSNGKVFHNITDCAEDWSEYPWRVNPDGYGHDWAEYNKWELWMNSESGKTINPKTMRGPFCESADVEDDAYDDGKATIRTINDLIRLKDKQEPFFLACGFWRPHLPFNVPKKYWDMYEREEIPLADNRFRPKNLPKEVQGSKEIFSYACVDNTDDEDFQRKAKHGYYAAVSYVDAQIGKILNALDSLGLAENTIVMFFGDHGWHLGEHNFWGKHSLMERATHVPLIVRAPGMKKGRTFSPVEFVDLYPTLCELCDIPLPKDQLDGISFVPILKNLKKKTKNAVYIQWQGGDNAVDKRYNYAEWLKKDGKKNIMLFDHKIDKQENENRSNEVKYKNVIGKLSNFISEKKKQQH